MRGTVLLRLLAAVFILGTFACGGGSDSTALSVSLQGPTASERGEYHELTATISNTDGGVANWSAKFAFEQNQSGGTLDSFDVVTDITGQAKSLYRAGQKAGVDIIQVEFQNYAKAVLVVSVAGAEPVQGRIRMTSGGLDADGGRIVIAQVFDDSGQPMADALVNFRADYGTVSPSSGTTNANGVVETVLTSDRSTTVRATSGNASGSITISKGEMDVARVTMQLFGPALDENDIPIPNTRVVRATVLNAAGRGMPGVTVNFGSDQGAVVPASVESNSNGVAEAVVYSATQTIVRATASNISAQIQYTP